MKNTIHIQKMEEKDIEEVADLLVKCWQNAYQGIVEQSYLAGLTQETKRNRIMENFKKTTHQNQYVVAKEEGEVIGYMKYGNRVDQLGRFLRYDAEIEGLYVKQGRLREGIGTELVNYAKQKLKQEKKHNTIIWCLKENYPSRKFYEKIGGILLGEKHCPIGEKEYTLVAYGYSLKS